MTEERIEMPEKAEPDAGVFRLEDGGQSIFPSALASGPWNPAHQHGGPVSGLLTRALDEMEAPGPMRLTRVTVEMFRGVPLTPLRMETRTVRAGRRIQSVEANLFDGEKQVARATGLRVRRADSLTEMETPMPIDPEFGPPPEGAPPMPFSKSVSKSVPVIPGFIRAVDIHVRPPETSGESAFVWTRLRCRLVEGEVASPTVRLASIADFASGTGNVMDYERYTSINPDLTLHILREPRTEWLGIRGITLRAEDGIGQSLATIFDEEGPVAHAQASLLLDRRPDAG
ncbi:MAG: thioesterase family protein [Myxococcota bacterium]